MMAKPAPEDVSALEPIQHEPEPEIDGPTVESQIEDLEKRVEEGRPLVDPEETEEEEQPGEEEAEDEAGEEEAAAEEEEEEPAEEEEPEEEVADEEEEAAEEEAEDEAEEDEEGESFTANIPGRRPGDPDIELELVGLSQEEQEGINRLRNGYMRGEDYRAQLADVDKTRKEVDQVAAQMDANPVGYIDQVLEDKVKIELARFLMTQEAVFTEVFPSIVDFEHDDSKREGESAKIERDILKRRQETARQTAAKEAARAEGDAIVHHLEGLAEDLTEGNLSRFMRFSLQDLQDWAEENPTGKLDLPTVHRILKGTGVFETFGVEPVLPDPEKDRQPARKRRPGRLAASKAKVEEAEKTSEKFKRKKARKRSAATTAPPGSGAPPVSHPFKKGETVEERIAHIEKHGIPKL